MRRTVYLFDVDGTLVDAGGSGRVAMDGAFEERFGRKGVLDGVSFGGMTDRGILREGHQRVGHEFDDEAFDGLIAVYLRHLERALATDGAFRVLAPAVELVAHCAAFGAVGLGTGNVRRGAELKLARAGLGERFAFGGFGDDAEERDALLEAGVLRGCAELGLGRDAVDVVVVGDTPRDVSAALAIGARCVAVTTGRYDAAALRAAGADTVLASLHGDEALEVLRGA